MKQYGIVDIGSNTIVLIIYDSVNPVHVKEYWSEPVHLVSYNDNGYMKPEGIEKTLAVLQKYKAILEEQQKEEMLDAASKAALGEGEYESYDDIFGSEE